MGAILKAAEQELKLRGYSPKTLKAYLHHIECQELLGHRSSKTTEIYTHVSRRDLARIVSPLDQMANSMLKRNGEEEGAARVGNKRNSD